MNEEEKLAIEILKERKRDLLGLSNSSFYSCDRKLYKEHVEAIDTILNLIDKQQKQIEFYETQELGYIAGYEDGKSHKQTAVAIKNENAQYKLIQKKIETLEDKNKTLEQLLQGNLYEMYKYYRELANSYQANCISKDKIKEIKAKWDKGISWANADDHYYAMKMLDELLGE